MADNIEDQITENALNPKIVKGDEGEVEEYDLDDLIKADKYLKNKAATSAGKGFRISAFSPGSSVGGR